MFRAYYVISRYKIQSQINNEKKWKEYLGLK